MIQDETAQYFLLRGNVEIKPDATSSILAAQVFVDTEHDTLTFVGLVEGKMKSDDIPSSERTEGSDIEIQQGVFQQVGSGLPSNPNSRVAGQTEGSNVAEDR